MYFGGLQAHKQVSKNNINQTQECVTQHYNGVSAWGRRVKTRQPLKHKIKNRSVWTRNHYRAVSALPRWRSSDPGDRKQKTLKQSLLLRSCITAEIHPITTNEHAGTSRASGLGPALGTPLKINGLDRHHGSKKSLKRNHHNLKRWSDLVLCV